MPNIIILVIASTGFQPHEYNIPKKILTDAGFTVVTASDKPGKATDSMGKKVEVDITLDQIKPDNYDGLFLVGGPGALDHLDTKAMHKILQMWAATGKPFGAICISPRILADADVLQGKKATGWDDDNELSDIFKQHQVTYNKRDVVVDGNIITASGPQVAEEFGNAIVKVFKRKNNNA